MKIEVWSDFVCPFCYIGKRRLEEAIQTTGLGDQIEVVFKAYQLDPNTPESSNESMLDDLASKYKVSVDEAKNMLTNIAEQAKTVGLEYKIDDMKVANTFKAHRVAKLAEQKGLADKMTEKLLHSYFVEGEAIGDKDVLLHIAENVGLKKDEVEQVLDSTDFTDEVNADIREARQIGVQGVPFFVINRKYAISGAQPAEAFANALEKVAEEEGIQPQLTVLNDEGSGVCTDDNCNI